PPSEEGDMNEAHTEVTRFPWYTVPLVRERCGDCRKWSPWCDDSAAVVLWKIEHECRRRLTRVVA
ncbi:MAG: hypothetical protein ACREN4_03730, partial [Candidatus Dormibacteria bacterium]